MRYSLDAETEQLLDQILWYAADTADLQRDDRTRDHMLAQINALAYTLGLVDEQPFLEEDEPKQRFTLVVDNDKDPQ